MDFSFSCDCGRTIDVSPDLCGKTVDCVCGQRVQFPKLDELFLKSQVEGGAFSLVEQLQAMYYRGELPQEKTCARCGEVTNEVLRCVVECERSDINAWSSDLPPFLEQLAIDSPAGPDYQKLKVSFFVYSGDETIVETPLRICTTCSRSLVNRNRAVVKLLKSNILYATLLEEYSDAVIIVDYRSKKEASNLNSSPLELNGTLAPNETLYSVRFPVWISACLFTIFLLGIAVIIDWFWLRLLPLSDGDIMFKVKLSIPLALVILGSCGMFLVSLGTVNVSQTTIKSEWLGRKTILDKQTTRFTVLSKNNFSLIDEAGHKETIERIMKNSGSLYVDILDRCVQEVSLSQESKFS